MLTEFHSRLFFTRHFTSWLCFGAILLIAALLRFSHLEIAHFGLDQSRAAQNVWEIAREGQFHSYYFCSPVVITIFLCRFTFGLLPSLSPRTSMRS